MTNEEKARKLAIQSTIDVDDNGNEIYNALVEAALLEMAQWKDEQFDEEKKELLGLVNMLSVDEHNQTIIEDLKALLQ